MVRDREPTIQWLIFPFGVPHLEDCVLGPSNCVRSGNAVWGVCLSF